MIYMYIAAAIATLFLLVMFLPKKRTWENIFEEIIWVVGLSSLFWVPVFVIYSKAHPGL
jgi:uncharacterized membrane protein